MNEVKEYNKLLDKYREKYPSVDFFDYEKKIRLYINEECNELQVNFAFNTFNTLLCGFTLAYCNEEFSLCNLYHSWLTDLIWVFRDNCLIDIEDFMVLACYLDTLLCFAEDFEDEESEE